MIFGRRYDKCYLPWFTWRPVFLRGPDEWDRMRRLDVLARVVWLRFVWRLRTRPQPYYAVPDGLTRNALLLDSIEAWQAVRAGIEHDSTCHCEDCRAWGA